jgi:hypothetical protein
MTRRRLNRIQAKVASFLVCEQYYEGHVVVLRDGQFGELVPFQGCDEADYLWTQQVLVAAMPPWQRIWLFLRGGL